jgi:hypothetical protein
MHLFTQTVLRGLTFLLLFTLVSCRQDYVTIQFDSEKEVSGMKFALKDISPGLPADWDEYEYVVHSGTLSPVDRAPIKARGHHEIPDLWNE